MSLGRLIAFRRVARLALVPALALICGVAHARWSPRAPTIASAPGLRIATRFPSGDGRYDARAWPRGCASRGLRDSASDPGGVRALLVAIRQSHGGRYWTGERYSSPTQVYEPATLQALRCPLASSTTVARCKDIVSWSYGLPLPPDGQYTLYLRVSDNVRDAIAARSSTSSTFTIDDVAPQVRITSGPQNQTPAGMPFGIAGNAASPLYPGAAAQPLILTLTNANSLAIHVTSLTASVSPISASGCAQSWFAVTPASLPAAGIVVPGNGQVTLPVQGARPPSIRMLDSDTNQDACEGANLTLTYTGSASS